MKQPHLGNLITKIRKDKRLTQEELADKCTVNVRTIQRIEAGEVNPRSYTLNIIYAALDYRPEDAVEGSLLKNLFYPTVDTLSNKSQQKVLITAMIGGIMYLCMAFFDTYVGATIMEGGDISIWTYMIDIVLGFVTSFFFYRGLVLVGNKYNSSALVIGAYFAIVFMFAISVVDSIYFIQGMMDSYLTTLPVQSVIGGFSGIVLGFGLYKLKDKFGNLAVFGAISEWITGFSFVVVILFFIGLITLIPAIICEVLLLYKVSTMITQVEEEPVELEVQTQ